MGGSSRLLVRVEIRIGKDMDMGGSKGRQFGIVCDCVCFGQFCGQGDLFCCREFFRMWDCKGKGVCFGECCDMICFVIVGC